MASLKYDLLKITALTNLHVGSGEINFGVVDNLVQRDVISEWPTIHSSSLKGALREFFEQEMNKLSLAEYVFGPAQTSSATGEGNYKFFSAHLLSLPVRSNKNPFFRAFSPEMLKDFMENLSLFGISLSSQVEIDGFTKIIQPQKNTPVIFEDLGNDVFIEDVQPTFVTLPAGINLNGITSLLGDSPVVFHNDDIKEIFRDLPVIPRNALENGKSINLWYEEVVPRQSCFYFILGTPDTGDQYFTDFMTDIQEHLIQIGANASIGYGYCKIEKINS